MNDGTEQLQQQSKGVRTSLKEESDFVHTEFEQAINSQKEVSGSEFQM